MAHAGRTHALGHASSESTTSSTVTMARFAARTASFCTPRIPQRSTLPFRSAFCAWMIVTSGLTAGVAASTSPVNGQVTLRMFLLNFGRSVPVKPRKVAKGSFAAGLEFGDGIFLGRYESAAS